MLAGSKIGTTKRGVGPCAEDKAARKPAIRFEDILDEDECARKVRMSIGMHAADLVQFHPGFCRFKHLFLDEVVAAGLSLGFREMHLSENAKRLHDAFEGYASEQADIYSRCGRFLAQYACPEVRDVIVNRENKFVLLEGAQGHYLDLDHGTFPDVTSTSPLVAGALQYLGLSRREVDDVIGVFKAYCTRVGNGVFDTEQDNSVGQRLRDVGREYGTTTGRPRRCGWFNMTEAREAIEKNGVDWLALMKLDVLDGMEKVYVGERLSDGSIRYHEFKGWKGPISDCREYNRLPVNARKYIEKVCNWVRCEPGLISVGPDERQTIVMPDFRQRFREGGIDLCSVLNQGEG
jgi:adenylosuccinate synthase